MTYEDKTNQWLVGRTIKKAKVTGDDILLEFTDGSKLSYNASDGGCSMWGCYTANGENVLHFVEGGAK